MTKTGKPDSYWADVMRQYAQGKYRFSTGKKPGSQRWKAAMQRIDACPLTPPYNQSVRKVDIFGKRIGCTCGYHKSAEQSGSTVSPENQPGQSSSRSQCPVTATVTTSDRCAKSVPQGRSAVYPAPVPQTSSAADPAPDSQGSSATDPAPPVPPTSSASNSAPALHRNDELETITCSLCSKEVKTMEYTQHLSDFHVQEHCEQCGVKVWGTVGLLQHIETQHVYNDQAHLKPAADLKLTDSVLTCATAQTFSVSRKPQEKPLVAMAQRAPPLVSKAPSLGSQAQETSHLTLQRPVVDWVSFLPKQFTKVIQPADQEWIAQCLYNSNGQLKQNISQNWFYPPAPCKPTTSPPNPHSYFRQRMFLWAPMRMWAIPLKCTECNAKMHHSGIYTKVREVIDIDSKYYLIGGDYPRCSKCMSPVCPWSIEILNQLDPSHRNKFPAVLTTHLALDRRCVTLLKPRTLGNSSSYLQQALQEIHSEEWARRTIDYLSDCELHKKLCALTQSQAVYQQPPPFSPVPLAQWFETAHANEILCHLDEMKGIITSTYGRILKLDSTKKITKKLAGGIEDTATWMTNIGNEFGEILNCVLTTGEGAGLDELCQGIVKRYQDAGEAEPEVIYVDRDCCCSATGVSPVLAWFRPWKSKVKLDIFHFMRRFNSGLTTEHHPLYGTFCSKMSSCIFEWDRDDVNNLKEAKRAELRKKCPGHTPTDAQILASISSSELAQHCRRRTRGVEETRSQIQQLLDSMWELTDTTGLPLINQESMTHVWEVQQKHLPCIQDPPGVHLYTTVSNRQKGDRTLGVLRCSRGSSSLESFHRHQCSFIPGWRCNALHTQMYMLEGASRWNINRAREAVNMTTSQAKLYDVRLMSSLNSLGQRVLQSTLLPEFLPPGEPTGERIAVEYLLSQSDRGDLLCPVRQNEISASVPELTAEVEEDECPDLTVCLPSDISPDAFLIPSVPEASLSQQSSQDALAESGEMSTPLDSHVDQPSTSTREGQSDSRGYPGWEAVDALAAYLVGLNRSITAFSNREKAEIVRLYSSLHQMDKSPTKYSKKCKKSSLSGPWRASRKRSGSAPGQQAAERLFMTHGQAAHRPDVSRLPECVALRLFKEFREARNRPKDNKGKTFGIPQSIVQAYSHIKQLVEDCKDITDQTNLVLVTINNTTVSSWLHDREKRADRDTLLQGVQQQLPQQVQVAGDVLLEAKPLPSAPVQHHHSVMEFNEPPNREGEAVIRRRQRVQTVTSATQQSEAGVPSTSSFQGPQFPGTQVPYWWGGYPQFPGPVGWQTCPPSTPGPFPPYQSPMPPMPDLWPPFQSVSTLAPPGQSSGPQSQQSVAPSSISQTWPSFHPAQNSGACQSRQRDWRHRKAAVEDQEREARGEPPKKRHTKQSYHYECKECGQPKNKATGHTQIKGKWYCPASGQTIDEWKASMQQNKPAEE